MKNFQVAIIGGELIPKEKAFTVLKEIKKTIVKAPVKSGQMVIKNVVDTGIDIIATKTVEKL